MDKQAQTRRAKRLKRKLKHTLEGAFKHFEENRYLEIKTLVKTDVKRMLRRFYKQEARRPRFDQFGRIYDTAAGMADIQLGAKPDDWVLSKDGRYVWDEKVTSADDMHLLGRTYVGKTLKDVEKHFEDNNSIWNRYFGSKKGGYIPDTDIQSYYDSRMPMAIKDVFGRRKWEHNLRVKNDSRTQSPYFREKNVNNDLSIIFKGRAIQVEGTLCLDDRELKYVADLNGRAFSSKNLRLKNYYDEHPKANSALIKGISGNTLKGKYFSISNNIVEDDVPVISLSFPDDKDYEFAKQWFWKYKSK